MEPLPRKKRFQIHLSTAVIVMLAAGALLWANTARRVEGFTAVRGADDFIVVVRNRAQTQNNAYGFPFTCATRSYYDNDYRSAPATNIDGWKVVLNVLIGGVGLSGVLCVSEWWIRRREARQGT
jgi:hypothetical protein